MNRAFATPSYRMMPGYGALLNLRFISVYFSSLLVVAIGCNDAGDRPDLGLVQGIVTIDGKPLPQCSVYFDPEGAKSSTGFTDAQGRYELRYIRDVRGAAVGEHQVRIIDGTGKQRVPKNYGEKAILTATVKSGANEINFPLEKNPPQRKP
jgi:hypothetical protein